MKHLTEAQYNELLAAQTERDRLRSLVTSPDSQLVEKPTLEHVEHLAGVLVTLAAQAGAVVTIEQRPLKPLAMRNYETVVSVRPAR